MNIVNRLKEILENDNVFLSGGAGVGKSYLTNELKFAYKKEGKSVVSLGSTAISAFNVGGVTLHSFFALGLCANLDELTRFDRKQKDKLAKLRKVLKSLDLLIIDEISMVSAEIFDLVAFRLKNSEFKGKVLVVGDFFQLPPVLNKDNKNSKNLFLKGYYAFSSLSWADFAFKNVLLSVAKRTNNAEFYTHLSLMREGVVNEELVGYFQKLLISANSLHSMSDDFTLLCGINKKADLINEQKLAKLKGDFIIFKAQCEKIDYDLEDRVLEKWIKSLNVLDELKLKIGAKVIFCINNYEAGYYNGEQGEVKAVFEEDGKSYIQVEKSNGTQVKLAPYTFLLEDFTEDEILATFSQFPIKPAYAITIHKSQGMSIEKLVCDIDNIFENGQLYVALSRAIEPKNLRIFYSRAGNFKAYFTNALKFDNSVLDFYTKTTFMNLEEKV